MADTLIKLSASYIGTNAGIRIPIPANSTSLSGLATDRSANVYVADTEQHTIYRVDSNGTSHIIAGKEGDDDCINGNSLDARFDSPRGLSVDASGNLYVADNGSGKIRVIDMNSTVSTLAGGFNDITDVSVAPNGDIIACDKGNHSIYRVEPGGRIFRVAGGVQGDVYGVVNGVKIKGSAARFNAPEGVAVGMDGKIYVADTGNTKIKVIDTDGSVNLITGTISGDEDGLQSVAKLTEPTDICIASKGNKLYILDKVSGGHKVKIVTMAGTVETVTDLTTEDAIALTIDVNETIYCVTNS